MPLFKPWGRVGPMRIPLHASLEGQVALVTGANRGIGHDIARRLQDHGATVFGSVRGEDAHVADGVQRIRFDVTDDAAVRDAIARIRDETGRLDILVNNAGIWGRSDIFHEADMAEIDRVLAANLRGAMMVTHEALPLLLERPDGRIVNVSSGSGSFHDGLTPRNFGYGISKAALNAFTLSLHGAYGSAGVLANSVCPGWVRTDMGGQAASRSIDKGAETPVWLARFQAGAPAGRFWRDQRPIPW